MGEVDPAFIQDIEHRPKSIIVEAGGIPLIDLSILNSSDSYENSESFISLVSEIGDACKNWGFFQVINHGVPSELRQKMETVARKFFSLPLEEKRKVMRDEENPMGYYDTEHTKNIRDWKEVFDFIAGNSTSSPALDDSGDHETRYLTNKWPEYPLEFREVSGEYAQAVEKLAKKLVSLISLSLGLPSNHLNNFFKEALTRLRLNHYPPCPSPDLALGVGRHIDTGALTVLSQDDVGGLNVKRRSDGEWILVKPINDSYIINIGSIMQVWSNDKYESAEHRVVVNSEKDRYSIPLFYNPGHNVIVKPLEELVSEKNPAKYRGYKWGDFMKTRRKSNFKKLAVENLQISHFKISE